MNKIATGTIVAATGLCLVATQAHAGGQQKATGGVIYFNGAGDSWLELEASGTPAAAKGFVQVRNAVSGAKYRGTVNCYNQDGNIARMTGIITSGVVAGGRDARGLFFTVTVQDNGEGSKASGGDLVAVNHRMSRPYDCSVPRTPQRPVEHGNLQVHDPSPSAAQTQNDSLNVSDYSLDEVSD
ncbi:MAG: hypothetical protein ACJ735_17045 [Actinomycetes bacterium]